MKVTKNKVVSDLGALQHSSGHFKEQAPSLLQEEIENQHPLMTGVAKCLRTELGFQKSFRHCSFLSRTQILISLSSFSLLLVL